MKTSAPDYAHDELSYEEYYPEVLIRVKNQEEIVAVLKYANVNNIPVVTRGSGTGLVGGAVALHGGIIIETTQMNRILELDRENLALTVEPGVLLMEIAQFAEANGFMYPPDPGEKSATHRRKYQHQRGRDACRQIRRNARLYTGTVRGFYLTERWRS